MANLSEDIQCAGSDTRPPMLDRTDFASWQQRTNSTMGTFRETFAEGTERALHLGPERPHVYSDLSPEDKERMQLNSKFVNNMLPEWGKFITAVKLNKGRQNRGQGNNARGAGVAGYGGAQNRVGNANPGVALDEEQLLFLAGGQDNVVDEDVDEQPVHDLALNVDNVF
ncbi:hypothetical protein Tco_0713520 [Tanacetum coccineum]